MTLKELKIGSSAVITSVGGEGALRQHFLDMGVIPGTMVKVLKYAPMGDPIEILLHGYSLTLRLADADQIGIEPAAETVQPALPRRKIAEHPGLGEDGKYHAKGDGDPLPEDTVLRFALVGNQNSGKTTLFNRLTGSNQHVGNFPGVTVDRKDGPIKGQPHTSITDLPGIYSMSPYTNEEIVSRNFVLNEHPHAIINIVDATNIERNLYLTMQLLEMDVPMVVALNMMDEMTANGGTVDINTMEAMLGVPVVPISAAKNSGVEELVAHAMHVAHFQERPVKQDFCARTENGGAVHKYLHSITHLIEDHAERAGLPVQFAASKLLEGDPLITKQLNLTQNELETIEHITTQLEHDRGLDKSAAIADMRFSYIRRVCDCAVQKPRESREHIRSQKIDKILTGKYTALPMFILIMGLVFFLTFNVIGAFLQDLLAGGIDWLTKITDTALTNANTNEVLHSLIIEGIFAGVGSVLSFLPIIVVMFFFLSLLEDSGYIARVAFFMDKLLRRIGLSGRSIVPMLIGFGCTVPAVMATRTMPSKRDRRMTILLTPFMSCSAKLPIYGFFVNAFFPRHGGLIMIGLYVFGILTGILAALLYRKTLFRGEAVPFVMELPNYRLPGVKNVALLLWDKAKDFLQRAFSVILIATVVIWFLKNFDFNLSIIQNPEDSILAVVSGQFAPLFQPIGLGDWRIVTSLIGGFLAKESVVSTMQVLFTEGVSTALSSAAGASLLVFSLLYTPCVAAITAIRQELGLSWATAVAVWQCVLAWIAACGVYWIGVAMGGM